MKTGPFRGPGKNAVFTVSIMLIEERNLSFLPLEKGVSLAFLVSKVDAMGGRCHQEGDSRCQM